MNINRRFVISGAIFGMTAVILGAFGAHMLKTILSADSLASFNTGIRYQMYHAILLLILSLLSIKMSEKIKNLSFWLICVGIICFSGSIYCLNLAPHFDLNMKFLGPITPIGGLMLITAWTLIVIDFIRNKD